MDSAASEPGGTGAGATRRIPLGTGRALVPVPAAPEPQPFLAGLGRSHGVVAAGVAVVMGLGFVAGTAVFASKPQAVVLAQAAPAPDTAAEALARVQGEVRALKSALDGVRAVADDGRQAETIRGLKRSVEALRGDLESARAASATAVGQLGTRIDRVDRDPSPKLAEISARLDRLDPDARIAQVASQLTARIDRVERQVSAGDATGSIPAATAGAARPPLPPARVSQPSPTGPAAAPVAAVPPARPEGPRAEPAPQRPEVARQEAANRPATLDGWLLRDVYGGVALVEGRGGGLREVAPGEYVPGVGEIRSIERRGRGWVVVTSRGLIQADNRW